MNALAANPAPVSPVTLPRSGRGVFWAANAIALLAVALGLRIWHLGNIPGINGDEAWSGVQALALVQGEAIDWRTPTGNPINVFFILPLAALHTVFAPSFVLLRFVSLASGLLALAVNFWLCRRVFDARTAVVSTLLLALLPINIAYSRFGWDASQSLLATLLVLYLPLWHYRRRPGTVSLPVAGTIALAAAILVHPTNIFAAPLVVVPIVHARRFEVRRKLHTLAVPARAWTLAVLTCGAIALAYFAWLALSGTAVRLHGPDELFAFLRNYLELFSGATVYQFISGVDQATGPLAWFAWLPFACKALFAVVVVFAAWGMIRRLAAEPSDRDVCLVLGWAVMLAGYFVVAGPGAIAPHFERYGICLVAPGALLLARGLGRWMEPGQSHARTAAWTLAIAAWLFPTTFYLGYFDFIERTGGRSHFAFRTAAVEPKLATFRDICGRRNAGRPARIVAGQWWNYWPLAYLAGGTDNLRVVSGKSWQRETPTPDSSTPEQTWYVEFAGTAADEDVLRRAAAGGKSAERRVVADYAGRPLLSIVGPVE